MQMHCRRLPWPSASNVWKWIVWTSRTPFAALSDRRCEGLSIDSTIPKHRAVTQRCSRWRCPRSSFTLHWMKEQTTSRPNPGRIMEALGGYQTTLALKGAVELDLFTHIADGASTAAEI